MFSICNKHIVFRWYTYRSHIHRHFVAFTNLLLSPSSSYVYSCHLASFLFMLLFTYVFKFVCFSCYAAIWRSFKFFVCFLFFFVFVFSIFVLRLLLLHSPSAVRRVHPPCARARIVRARVCVSGIHLLGRSSE